MLKANGLSTAKPYSHYKEPEQAKEKSPQLRWYPRPEKGSQYEAFVKIVDGVIAVLPIY